VAQSLYERVDGGFASLSALGVGGVAALVHRALPLLLKGDKLRKSLGDSTIAAALGFVLLITVAVSWGVVAYWLSRGHWTLADISPDNYPLRVPIAMLAIAFLLAWLTGRSLTFVNLSSLQAFYAARLRRAYLGASNPNRGVSLQNVLAHDEKRAVTKEIQGDDIMWRSYTPHEEGGPLQLMSVTVNHTVNGHSQLELRDRKGVTMTIGPAGVSVGTRSHATWQGENLIPIQDGASSIFVPLGTSLAAEPCSLSRWMAISGAAFSTGLGARTRSGVSILLGAANVRLGYWWSCGTEADHDPSPIRRLFRTQYYLYQEFLARFPGATQRDWYLTDGGHSENTGAYELIRRRVQYIILLDNGADPEYQFEDFGNLVRRARIDLGVEIVESDINQIGGTTEQKAAAQQMLGSLSDARRTAAGAFGISVARRSMAMFGVKYPDGGRDSLLVLVKPTLLGTEPADILCYEAAHPAFPQEPTSDQFFDEAQWESYRRLGEYTGEKLFRQLGFPG
jgi:hypothetical protein